MSRVCVCVCVCACACVRIYVPYEYRPMSKNTHQLFVFKRDFLKSAAPRNYTKHSLNVLLNSCYDNKNHNDLDKTK